MNKNNAQIDYSLASKASDKSRNINDFSSTPTKEIDVKALKQQQDVYTKHKEEGDHEEFLGGYSHENTKITRSKITGVSTAPTMAMNSS